MQLLLALKSITLESQMDWTRMTSPLLTSLMTTEHIPPPTTKRLFGSEASPHQFFCTFCIIQPLFCCKAWFCSEEPSLSHFQNVPPPKYNHNLGPSLSRSECRRGFGCHWVVHLFQRLKQNWTEIGWRSHGYAMVLVVFEHSE